MNEAKAITIDNEAFLSIFMKFNVGFDFFLIIFTFFQWDLIEILTPFLLPFVLLILWAILGILVLVSAISALFDFKKYSWKGFWPIIVNGSTLLILLYVPFTSIYLNLEFLIKKSGYEQVVKMVENNQLQSSNERGSVTLPSKYKYLSRGGGEIIVDKGDGVTSVFFYTYRGVLDNFSGHMYRSNDTPPPQDFMGGDWAETTRKRPYWYFCASR
jgi:hypothetical protein